VVVQTNTVQAPGRLLTTAEACSRLGVSRWTLDRMVRDGQLQQVRVRSAIRYPAGELDAYVRRQLETHGRAL
jgi:excisionase family DNA binding protein